MAACAYFFATLTDFPANASITVKCWGSGGGVGYFWTQTVTTNGSGAFSGQLQCYYGYLGTQARVDSVSPAVSSNQLTW